MSLVIDGKRIETPGLETVCWLDDAHVPRATDGRPRVHAPVGIVLHSVHGKLGPLRPGVKPSTRAETFAHYQANTPRDVSWDCTLDTDGTVVQSADPARWTCWHAGHVNGWTAGIELVQDGDGALYEGQLAALVRLLDLLCSRLPVPRRVPVDAQGAPLRGVVKAWQSTKAGGREERWSGIVGHRNLTTTRGPGDPGDPPFLALLAAGFEAVIIQPH